MTNTNIDTFKKYESYANMYIVENYIRMTYHDTVIYSSDDLGDVLDYMDDNELWDDCTLYFIDEDGNALYPEF